jgi:hypothetical protein
MRSVIRVCCPLHTAAIIITYCEKCWLNGQPLGGLYTFVGKAGEF